MRTRRFAQELGQRTSVSQVEGLGCLGDTPKVRSRSRLRLTLRARATESSPPNSWLNALPARIARIGQLLIERCIEARVTDHIEGEKVNGQYMIFDDAAKQVAERDPDSQKCLICLMDGQRSLWNLQAEHFQCRQMIADGRRDRLYRLVAMLTFSASLRLLRRVDECRLMIVDGRRDRLCRPLRC